MKKIKILIKPVIMLSISLCLFGCKNSDVTIPQTTSINVTNAVIGGATIAFNTDLQTIANNSYAKYIEYAGQSQVKLYTLPIAATATTPAISSVTYYNQTLQTVNNGHYSIFLSGTSPAQIDATVINETYPYAYVDSLVGVRFINLSPNSNPISINVKGSANGSEVTGIAYKTYSDFKQYAAKKANSSYIFEIRDAATGSLITNYTLTTTTPLFHNVTIVLRGLITSPGIILDNDY